MVGLEARVKEAEAKLTETELESEEAAVPKVHSRKFSPSPEEYNRHCATHLPYRNWCPICVQAKRKNPSHQKKRGEDKEHDVSVLSMDYMYLNESEDEGNLPILVIHDSISRGIWSILVKRKGNYCSYVSERICKIVTFLGYAKLVIKCDQEPALNDVMYQSKKKIWNDIEEYKRGIVANLGGQIVIRNSPVGESQSNGAVENAIQRVQGQIRAIKLDIEANSEARLNPSMPIWAWMVQYAAQTILYWRMDPDDGLTAMQKIRGRAAMTARPRFGEKVLYKIAKTIKLGKTEARWRYGVWLGSIETSDEHLVGTDLAVVKCRAVDTLAEDKRFDEKAVVEMKGTPWKPSTMHAGSRIRTHIKEESEDKDAESDDDDAEVLMTPDMIDQDIDAKVEEVREAQKILDRKSRPTPYGFNIKAGDIYKYGPTEGCVGCHRVLGLVDYQKSHNLKCRARIMELMENDIEDKARVDQWKIAKGIKDQDDDTPRDDPVPKAEARADPVTVSSRSADHDSRARSSDDLSPPTEQPKTEEPKRGVKNKERDDDNEEPSRPAARSRKDKAAAKRKREEEEPVDERP